MSVFDTWRYFVIPVGATGALRTPLLGLAPHVVWPDRGIRWRNDGEALLLGVPPGAYPDWAEAALAPYELSYQEASALGPACSGAKRQRQSPAPSGAKSSLRCVPLSARFAVA